MNPGAHLREKLSLTVGLTALWGALWYVVPRYVAGAAHRLPETALEGLIPFVESSVYVYLSICLFMPLGALLTSSRPALLRHGAGFLAITLLAFAVFIAYPVEVPAPAVTPRTLLYRLVLADTRLNNFPSLHAAYTVYALGLWPALLGEIRGARRRVACALGVGAWAGALLASVLLLKQHTLADVLAGVALGTAAAAVSAPAGGRAARVVATRTETAR